MKYIFYLEPFVYIRIVEKDILLYNTLDGNCIIRYSNPNISNLIETLSLVKNLNVVYLDEIDRNNIDIKEFIDEIKNKFMGDIYVNENSKTKPIQLVLHGVDELPNKAELEFTPIEHLKNINLYINNTTISSRKNVTKQFLWMYNDVDYNELDVVPIRRIFEQLSGSNIKINILGGNILLHSEFESIVSLIQDFKMNVDYYIYYADIDIEKITILGPRNINVLIDCLTNSDLIHEKLEQLNSFSNIKYNFLIETKVDFDLASNIITSFNLSNYSFYPFYNNDNDIFFKNNVFIDKTSILKSKLTMRDLLAKQHINFHHYGEVSILPNCDIYANLNDHLIGNLKNSNFLTLVNQEITEGKTWKNHRGKVQPCMNCLFRDLCPSISNYEYVLEKFNLCNVL